METISTNCLQWVPSRTKRSSRVVGQLALRSHGVGAGQRRGIRVGRGQTAFALTERTCWLKKKEYLCFSCNKRPKCYNMSFRRFQGFPKDLTKTDLSADHLCKLLLSFVQWNDGRAPLFFARKQRCILRIIPNLSCCAFCSCVLMLQFAQCDPSLLTRQNPRISIRALHNMSQERWETPRKYSNWITRSFYKQWNS